MQNERYIQWHDGIVFFRHSPILDCTAKLLRNGSSSFLLRRISIPSTQHFPFDSAFCAIYLPLSPCRSSSLRPLHPAAFSEMTGGCFSFVGERVARSLLCWQVKDMKDTKRLSMMEFSGDEEEVGGEAAGREDW